VSGETSKGSTSARKKRWSRQGNLVESEKTRWISKRNQDKKQPRSRLYFLNRCICRRTQKEISKKSIHQRKSWRVYTDEDTKGRWKQSCRSRRRRGCEVAGVVDWPLASRAGAVLQEMNMRRRTVQTASQDGSAKYSTHLSQIISFRGLIALPSLPAEKT